MDTNHDEPTLTFIAEWFDSHPQVTKQYLLKFYPSSNEVEMKETSTRTKFLKRTKVDNESLSKDDFHIGATVILFGRDLKLVEYGDNQTRELLDRSMESSIVVLTPRVAFKVGYVVKKIEEAGLILVNMKSFQVEDDVVAETSFVLGLEEYELKRITDSSALCATSKDEGQNMTSDMNFCVAIEFRGEHCMRKLLEIQSTLRQELRQQLDLSSPSSSDQNLLVVTSPTSNDVNVYKDLFLKCKHKPTVTYHHTLESSIPPDTHAATPTDKPTNPTPPTEIAKYKTTCCVIKAHIIKSKKAGSILNEILSTHGHAITAIQIFYLDRPSAVEFYEVYKTAVKNYTSLIDEMCSGPILAMEVKCDPIEFRNDVAGPWDVEMAKCLCSDSIRAKYGVSNVQNAIHCTDVPEETINELSYFFDILQGG